MPGSTQEIWRYAKALCGFLQIVSLQQFFILNAPVFGNFCHGISQGAYILFASEKSQGAYSDSDAYFGDIFGQDASYEPLYGFLLQKNNL